MDSVFVGRGAQRIHEKTKKRKKMKKIIFKITISDMIHKNIVQQNVLLVHFFLPFTKTY